MIQWIETTPAAAFAAKMPTRTAPGPHTLTLDGQKGQTLRGFGGCFNELGWTALQKACPADRAAVLNALFGPEGLGLSFNRIPIGASDYAAGWYSCDETPGDKALEHFTLARDEEMLIPYIRAAQAVQPDMRFFASPWSPPTWMKQPPVYNYGRLRREPEILDAYARYLQTFVAQYAARGIPIDQLHVQNEPFADQKFPSCLWDAEDFRVFIRDYLGPQLEKAGASTEIFLGTLNGPEEMKLFGYGNVELCNYNRYLDTILFDEAARRYIKGIGYQWAGRAVVERTRESFPELELIQTENECGEGKNSWGYAQYMFGLMRHYFRHGVTAYTYWNMVLASGGESSWGWHQNSLFTVAPDTGRVTANPEFYVMKHFARFVKPGARVLGVAGHWSSAAAAFENPDGSRILVVQNALARPETFTFADGDKPFSAVLAPDSFNAFVL